MRSQALVIAGTASLLAATSVLAWEYGSTDLGEGQIIHHAAIVSADQTANIIFGCNNLVPGQIQFQMVTDKPGSAERGVTAIITAGGQAFPFDATLGDVEGMQMITTGQSGVADDAARAVYAATDQVAIDVEGKTYRFDGGGYGDAFGAMMDACG